MAKTLELVFRNSGGKEVVIALPDPKNDISKAAVDSVMQQMISSNIFVTTTGALTQRVEGRIKTTDAVVLS